MRPLSITDVRIVPGDSGFLLDDGSTAILYDTGFGFTGSRMADRIQELLGTRSLDYIFLTHSHYDHALGSTVITKRYPNAQIVASAYTQSVFQKHSAKETMYEMDRKAARRYHVSECQDLTDYLKVDLVVHNGDHIQCGNMDFTVVDLPGHTKCSIGFFLAENRLLLGTETLGVYVGKEPYLPSYLVGYQLTMESFQKAMSLGADSILIPHYGVVSGQEAQKYLQQSEQAAALTASIIKSALETGQTHEEILQVLTQRFYQSHIEPVYRRDAFELNTTIMIRLIEAELVHK